MASPSFAPDLGRHRRISLAKIDAVVSARLGATRGLGNSQPACFNRQLAMYLAKTVAAGQLRISAAFTMVVIIQPFATEFNELMHYGKAIRMSML